MTPTYAELMREWHAIARHVEDIPDDDLRHAACARMDEILAECGEIERMIAQHDDGALYRHDVLTDVRL
jgi:hypothetical protein